MPKKKEIKILTPQEVHDQLTACINCIYENTCKDVFPFPLNLCECCDKYIKDKLKNFKN